MQFYKRIMFEQDIFYSPDSNTDLSLVSQEMSFQHQQSLFACIEDLSTHPRLTIEEKDQHQSQNIELQFDEIDFFPVTNQSIDDRECQSLSLGDDNQKAKVEKRNTRINKSVNNNVPSYIIKHCFKKMLSRQQKGIITIFCEEFGVTYPQFRDYWFIIIKPMIHKHVGVNQFQKVIRSKSPFVEICKYYFTVYLREEYTLFIMASSINDKVAYLQSAVKILYLVKVSKAKSYEIIQKAQMGLKL